MPWSITQPTKITNGEEYNNGEPIDGATFKYGCCEYCGKEVVQIKDSYRGKNFGYLGNQAQIARNYLASPAVEAVRKYHKVGWEVFGEQERENGLTFNQENGNILYNVHSKLHVRKRDARKFIGPWRYAKGGAYKILCNNCFRKTYKRVVVPIRNNMFFEFTVLPHETLEDVILECGVPYVDPETGIDPLADE